MTINTMTQFSLTLLFYAVESLTTAIFLSLLSFFTKPNANIEQLFGYTVVFFVMRIAFLQALIEMIIIYYITHYGGWEKFWLIMLGVFASAAIWGGLIGLGSRNDFGLLKVAFVGYGIPLFLGTLFSWWVCYKWIGLKA